MNKMDYDVPLDYAIFQLSPRRSRCELFVSYDDTKEKLASGLVKPFVTHLKIAEEQVALAEKSIKLDAERSNDAETWFTKSTLERFVRFVSTPEVLEMVNTFDAEMSQLEAARRIYSQGTADDDSGTAGGACNGVTVESDVTKKELLKAIDIRLSAVKQDLTTACSRASTAGFNLETVSRLRFFADHFGAHRLSGACSRFIAITQQRADLFNFDNTTSKCKSSSDSVLRSSTCSDMSLDEPFNDVDEKESAKVKDNDKDKALGSTTVSTTSKTEPGSMSTGKPQLTRRLSVQERINLFENKAQISPSITTPSTGAKPELRKLSSEVNLSTDKAVLRRWSGASDMSIDVRGGRKDSVNDANSPTPSASSHKPFPPKPKDLNEKSEEGDKDSKLSVRTEFGSISAGSSGGESNSKIPSFSGRSSDKDHYSVGFQSRVASFGRIEECENQSTVFLSQIMSRNRNIEQFGSPNQTESEEKLKVLSSVEPQEEIGNNSVTSTEIEETLVGNQGEANYGGSWGQQVSRSQFSGFQRKSVENDLDSENSKDHLLPVIPNTREEADVNFAQPRWNSVGEVKKTEGEDFESIEIQTDSVSMPTETSGSFRERFQGNCSGSDQATKRGGRKEMDLMGKGMIENQGAFSSVSMVNIHRVRQPKGNQGVNDELKMKANELEKLFAEHKLRAPSDQSNSARGVRPAESPMTPKGEPAASSSPVEKFYSTPLSKTLDYHDYDATPRQNIYTISFSDDSRGKLYQKYMQKRDAKLREDWRSNRPEKEAQMKAMQDSLEKSRSEMKVKLAGSAEKKNSAKSKQSKKVQQSKNTSSSASRNSVASIPRSSGKASNSATGKRRLPYDNPLAQSVPNFSDLRKENTKPSSAGSKAARPLGRIHTRKKSANDDLLLVNGEKPRRFMKKSMASTTELNSTRSSDDIGDNQLIPSIYHSEKNEDYEEISNDMISRTLPKEDISKVSAIVAGEAGRNQHRFDDTILGLEEKIGEAIHKEHDYETRLTEEPTYVDSSKGRLSHESDNSRNSGYEISNAPRFVSQVGIVSDADLPDSIPPLFHSTGSTLDSPGESPGYWSSRLQNSLAFAHETSDIDVADSPNGSPALWNFHTLSQSEAETARMRTKWGAYQKPVVDVDSSRSPSRKDITKGLKRFLKFGRKNRASECLVDWISATTSEGDDSEDGRDFINRTSEDLRKSRMGFSQSHNSDEGFHESELFNAQVQALQSSIATPPSNFKLKEEQMSGNSLKGPKSFFSLSNFRSKGSDAKPR